MQMEGGAGTVSASCVWIEPRFKKSADCEGEKQLSPSSQMSDLESSRDCSCSTDCAPDCTDRMQHPRMDDVMLSLSLDEIPLASGLRRVRTKPHVLVAVGCLVCGGVHSHHSFPDCESEESSLMRRSLAMTGQVANRHGHSILDRDHPSCQCEDSSFPSSSQAFHHCLTMYRCSDFTFNLQIYSRIGSLSNDWRLSLGE
jgi:hypothetical protein